ncbi:hypothetical protein AAMO2058_000963000 [Amorphochlora amoebiformis]|eukprot:1319774-Amorphochlora_amoeboformis.AAC.3
MPQCIIGKYTVDKVEVGSGASCSVKSGKHRETGRRVAVKFYRKSGSANEAFERECCALRRVRHPHIIEIEEAITDQKSKNVIIQPFADHGDFLNHISEHGALGEELARAVVRKIAGALEACHERGIIHRDLKPENMLLDGGLNPKICDFGFSAISNFVEAEEKMNDANIFCSMKTKAGSLSYMAPEVCNGKQQTAAVDVWSLGVCAFIFVTGFPPYVEPTPNDYWFRTLTMNTKLFWMAHERHANFSSDFKNVIERLLCKDPKKRITLKELRQHKWMQTDCLSDEEMRQAFAARLKQSP